MKFFKKVIAKECTNPDCTECRQSKPANSPGICAECGLPMAEETKTRYPLILAGVAILLLVVGVGGYVGYYVLFYGSFAKKLDQAIQAKDLGQLTEVYQKLRGIDNLRRCKNCTENAHTLLQNLLKEALNAENLPDGERLIKLVTDLGFTPDPASQQQLDELRRVDAIRKQFAFQPVPIGDYQISPYIQGYVQGYFTGTTVKIDKPFTIQAGEVTVQEFRQYANSLSEADRAKLGSVWEKDRNGAPYPDNRPVENVSWQTATGYAKWLSQQTNWNLQLPTLPQWVAAAVKYAEDKPVLYREDTDQPMVELRAPVDHLLGNLREWSSDQSGCQSGEYRLLGENYRTRNDPGVIGNGYCVPGSSTWTGVGFRLVRLEK